MKETKKTQSKLGFRVKINLGIFAVVAILFAVMPRILFGIWYPSDAQDTQPEYAGNFIYVLHDICPCSTGDDDCSGYYACGPDKANITYNLDTAPKELIDAAKRDAYFEGQIESSRQSAVVMRQYLLCDICYLMAFISLIGGVLYWNHNR